MMINISKLTKEYGKDTVLNNLSFKIKDGEVVGFLGPNGAGKSTTLKTIVGLTRPTSGSMKIDEFNAGDLKSHSLVGYLPENPNFYEYLSGREFLLFVGELNQINKEMNRKQADELLKLVGLTSEDKHIRFYSKGMRQRLGIAQALVGDPKILLLDEPLDGLDPIGRSQVKEILLKLKKAGKTILISSHILSDIEEIADRIIIIKQGKLIVDKSVKDYVKGDTTLEKEFVKTVGEQKKSHV